MKRSVLPTLGLMFSLLAPAAGRQTPVEPRQQSAPDEDEVVRISTNLVQVDAVVTDGDGRQVTDLDARDFEILEDGKPQTITNFSYVSLGGPEAHATPAPARRKDREFIPPPPARLRPEQVRRTLALVVDDLSLSFESTVFVRRALNKFIDEQMQPGDLAAVIMTSAGSGALQQFTADRRRLHAAAERIRWYPFGRGGIDTFKPLDLDPLDKLKARSQNMAGATTSLAPDYSGSNGEVEEFLNDTTSLGTLGAVKYIIQGMKERPGRNSVLLLSDGLKIFNPARRGQNSNGLTAAGRRMRDPDVNGMIEALRRLTDLANRSSVVIYAMDARGLPTTGLSARDQTDDIPPSVVTGRVIGRGDEYLASQDGQIGRAHV